MFTKYTKIIVRDPSTGSLVQMLPEVKTATEVDAESSLPVSSSAVASWGEAFVRKGSESETISGDVTFEGRTTYSDDIAMSGHKIVDPSGIELSPSSNTDNNGGYIDFRYNNAEESTSRIIESASGTVTINNVNISNGSVSATTFTGALNGNAATTTKLATARTINGTSFDGTGNITTTSWGTARNISISDSDGTNTGAAVSVNGSGNATLKLPATIKASITGDCSGSSGSCTGNAATATKLATARSLWGNNFDGSAAISGTINGTPSIEFKPTATNSNNGGYLDFHYNQSTADYTSRIIESASGTLSINNVTITTGKVVTATTFTGALSGNASTATKLATARKINGVSFNGSADITVADSTKVAKTGDTMTGTLTVKPAGPGLKLCNNVVTKGTNPSSNTWTYLELLDNANGRLGWIGNSYNTSGVTSVGMYVRKQDANTESSLGVGYNASKAAYTWAPTPAAADNSTQIATTAWVRGRLHISTADPSGGTDGDIWFKYS